MVGNRGHYNLVLCEKVSRLPISYMKEYREKTAFVCRSRNYTRIRNLPDIYDRRITIPTWANSDRLPQPWVGGKKWWPNDATPLDVRIQNPRLVLQSI
jgi:hypothetical protein